MSYTNARFQIVMSKHGSYADFKTRCLHEIEELFESVIVQISAIPSSYSGIKMCTRQHIESRPDVRSAENITPVTYRVLVIICVNVYCVLTYDVMNLYAQNAFYWYQTYLPLMWNACQSF